MNTNVIKTIIVSFALICQNISYGQDALPVRCSDEESYYVNRDKAININGYFIGKELKNNSKMLEKCKKNMVPLLDDLCSVDIEDEISLEINILNNTVFSISQNVQKLSPNKKTIFGVKRNDSIHDVLKKLNPFIKKNNIFVEYYYERRYKPNIFVLYFKFDEDGVFDPGSPSCPSNNDLTILFDSKLKVKSIHIGWADASI